MSSAYKRGTHRGHDYEGTWEGRASRKDSKISRALKGVASFDLLNEVAREDAKRRRERQQLQGKQQSNEGNSSFFQGGVSKRPYPFL
jgi:hypothetical protein